MKAFGKNLHKLPTAANDNRMLKVMYKTANVKVLVTASDCKGSLASKNVKSSPLIPKLVQLIVLSQFLDRKYSKNKRYDKGSDFIAPSNMQLCAIIANNARIIIFVAITSNDSCKSYSIKPLCTGRDKKLTHEYKIAVNKITFDIFIFKLSFLRVKTNFLD